MEMTIPKIPVGRWAADGFDWLETNLAIFFDTLSLLLEGPGPHMAVAAKQLIGTKT